MIILMEIALVVALVALVGNFLLRGRRESEREAVLERRVEAYIATIRREGDNKDLSAMGDVELRDLLLSAARNLKVQSDRKWLLLVGGGIASFFAAIMIATSEGTRGFALALLVGAIVLYGLNEFIGRRMREPLVERGIDVERLRVE